MRSTSLPSIFCRLLSVAALAGFFAGAVAASADQAPPVYKPPVPARKAAPQVVWLADTFAVARVDTKAIRVHDYIDRFFSISPEFRATSDSVGRVEFLQRLVNKEVLARVAHASNYEESFQERAQMKAYVQTTLGNALFEHAIRDSVKVTDAEAESLYAQMKRDLRLARVRFGTRETAARMRRDLVAGRLSMSRAWELRLRMPGDESLSPDVGWHVWNNVPSQLRPLFHLPVGGVSEPIAEPPGFSLYQVKEERPAKIGDFRFFRRPLIARIKEEKTAVARERLVSSLRADAAIRLDSANVTWTAARFPQKISGAGSSHLVLDTSVPVLSPEDTARTVATYRDGKVTVGRLLDEYRAIPDMLRPSLETPDGIAQFIDVIVLEPRFADIARQRGYDRDSSVVARIEQKREEIVVERLYADSIEARTFVPPAERRKYYEKYQQRFVTSPNARYAMFYLADKKSADSIATRLRKGVKPEVILREDSLKGVMRGRIDGRARDDTDNPFFRQVFFDMKVGDVTMIGPDPGNGSYNVLKLLYRDSGKPVPFADADDQIDEYLRQEMSERLLKEFLARHSQGISIESHPELVMRIRLVDSTSSD